MGRRLEIGAFKPHAAEALAEYLADGVNGVRKEEYRLTLELDFKYRRGLVYAVVLQTLGKVSRQDILVGDKHFNGRIAEREALSCVELQELDIRICFAYPAPYAGAAGVAVRLKPRRRQVEHHPLQLQLVRVEANEL